MFRKKLYRRFNSGLIGLSVRASVTLPSATTGPLTFHPSSDKSDIIWLSLTPPTLCPPPPPAFATQKSRKPGNPKPCSWRLEASRMVDVWYEQGCDWREAHSAVGRSLRVRPEIGTAHV